MHICNRPDIRSSDLVAESTHGIKTQPYNHDKKRLAFFLEKSPRRRRNVCPCHSSGNGVDWPYLVFRLV